MRIRLKISIAGNVTASPGQEVDLAESIARGLVAAGQAEFVTAPVSTQRRRPLARPTPARARRPPRIQGAVDASGATAAD